MPPTPINVIRPRVCWWIAASMAVDGAMYAIFYHQGQCCEAGTRLLLHNSIADEFIHTLVEKTKKIKVGDPMQMTTDMGPLVSQKQYDRVMSYIDVAKEQGSTVLTGGKAPSDAALAAGYYVEPTVVTAKPEDRVCQEEVFGPFVTVTRFTDEDEVIRMANSTDYGLGGGLWTEGLQRAHRVARAMRSGMVWINTYKRVNPGSPFGGVGQSGYGREMGFEAMHEYTDAKSVWVNVDANLPPYYPR